MARRLPLFGARVRLSPRARRISVVSFLAVVAFGLAVFMAAWNRACVGNSCPSIAELGAYDPNQAAKVYAQLSYHEGFGVAVAEAMACGCIPVTTDRGSLPEVGGGIGYCVPVDDPTAAAAAFRAAVDEPDPARGVRAREHIRTSFAPAARASAVIGAIEEMVR